jgi:uncharacterized membrane protein
MSVTIWIIIGGAVLTYFSRAGGHMVLSLFDRVHPRVEAALNAVPAAVLTTLVAPAAVDGSPAELTALVVSGLVAFRFGLMTMFLVGTAVLFAMRYLLG